MFEAFTEPLLDLAKEPPTEWRQRQSEKALLAERAGKNVPF